MNEFVRSCLQQLREGEVAAALVLADYCQDVEHQRWERISECALALQSTSSFFELFGAIDCLAVLVSEEDDSLANAAYSAFQRLVSHV